MKIFVTGATGFIGRAFCRIAHQRGHHLLALCRNADAKLAMKGDIAVGTLADTPWSQVKQFSPDAVLHLAWVATPGVYLTSPENDVWLEQSKAWLHRIHDIGVPHIAGTGTCIEYAASPKPLNETSSLLRPSFPYSQAKAALFDWLRGGNISARSSWTWFRVFYPYGPGEHPNRISTSLIQQLNAGKSLVLRTPHSVKDYIFIDDVASAMCQVLEYKVAGAVNIGTGQGVSIENLAQRLAKLLDKEAGMVKYAAELGHDPTPIVVADNRVLQATGWRPRIPLDAGLQRLIDSLMPVTERRS